jgi:YtxH-like protein
VGNSVTKNKVKDWVRVAAKLSLLFTDPKVRSTVSDGLKERADDVSNTLNDKYDEAVNRLDNAVSALQGGRQWPSHVASLLLGVGVGAGLGILLAPAAGWETRRSIRDKAVDVKDRIFESATSAVGRVPQPVTSMPFTGTEA